MTIANFSVGEAAISQPTPAVETKKAPPKRQYLAKADAAVVPEPR